MPENQGQSWGTLLQLVYLSVLCVVKCFVQRRSSGSGPDPPQEKCTEEVVFLLCRLSYQACRSEKKTAVQIVDDFQSC